MRKLFCITIILASLLTGAVGLSGRAVAVDANGNWLSFGTNTCEDFLQTEKDEVEARAKVLVPLNGIFYDGHYGLEVMRILGFVTGFNAGRLGVYNALPGLDGDAVIALVSRACKRQPKIQLGEAIIIVIVDHKEKWKSKKD